MNAFKPNSSRALPIGLLVTGVLLMAINLIAMQISDYWFPKLMMSGISVTCLGLMMMIFPPAEFHVSGNPSAFFKETYKYTKKLNMFMWLVSLVISVFVIIWYVDYMNLSVL